MNDYKFGNFLCSLREARNLTQAELARILSVTPAAVSKWENGESKPRLETLFKLAETLEVTVEELMSGKFTENKEVVDTVDNKVKSCKNKSHHKFNLKKTNRIIIFLIIIFLLITSVTVSVPIVYNYTHHFSKKSYYSTTKTVSYNDIFYNSDSKLCELYSLGNIGHMELNELSNRPEVEESYKKRNIKIFDSQTIDKFNKLIQQCKFIPVERQKAFRLALSFDKKDFITYSEISLMYWVEDEIIDLFSKEVINDFNEQIEGISHFTLFEKNGKLYLFGAYAYEMLGASWLEYERPNFADTKTVIYEIEQSEAAQEIINSKKLFNPGRSTSYMPHSINWLLLTGEFVIFAILLIFMVKKQQHNE